MLRGKLLSQSRLQGTILVASLDSPETGMAISRKEKQRYEATHLSQLWR